MYNKRKVQVFKYIQIHTTNQTVCSSFELLMITIKSRETAHLLLSDDKLIMIYDNEYYHLHLNEL